MRQLFAQLLLNIMKRDKSVWLVTGGVGYGVLDEIKAKYPKRFINCEASEQAMLDIAVGLTLSGKRVFVYSITPFLLYRPFESIRNYLNHEQIPVILVGSGRGKDYGDLGFTHWSDDDSIMNNFKNIKSYHPTKKSLPVTFYKIISKLKPCYLNLSR